MTDWRNRIVGHGEESPEDLVANPRNYRIHPKRQQDVLEGAIKDVGFIRSVTVNRRTGFVLDGHLRVSMAISSGQKSIPVEYVDLSEAEEAEALATLDPIAALAATDKEQFGALMADIGNADAAVAELLGEMYSVPSGEGSDEEVQWQDRFEVVVECSCEEEQQRLYERLSAEGYSARVLTM